MMLIISEIDGSNGSVAELRLDASEQRVLSRTQGGRES
jgi:hypothetical protein